MTIDKEYIQRMEAAKKAMQEALTKVQPELLAIVPASKKEKVQNLAKSRQDADPQYLCFDDIWAQLSSIFDTIQENNDKPHLFKKSVEDFKTLLFTLIDAGIPFDLDKNVNFWSTQLAREEAERYSLEHDGTTDALATLWFRKILIEWPEENLTIFHDMITASKPIYRAISKVFWTAISDIYLDSAKPGSESHVFFADSFTMGNYFEEIELPKAREKNLKLFIHVFDIKKKNWMPPVELDSEEGNKIPIRRRAVHPLDQPETLANAERNAHGKYVWKKLEFKLEQSEKPLVIPDAPKVLTLGKLKTIFKKWQHLTAEHKIKGKEEEAKPIADKFSYLLNEDNSLKKLSDLEIVGLANDYFNTHKPKDFFEHMKNFFLSTHPDKNANTFRSTEAFKYIQAAAKRIKENLKKHGQYIPEDKPGFFNTKKIEEPILLLEDEVEQSNDTVAAKKDSSNCSG